MVMRTGNEAAERMAFFSIAVNMVSYLVTQMHQSLPDAATHVSDWTGASYFLTLLGAFLADSYLGRFKTIVVFSSIYALVGLSRRLLFIVIRIRQYDFFNRTTCPLPRVCFY